MRLASTQITHVMKHGDRKYQNGVVTHIIQGERNFGCVIVGKKVAKKAVIRNRIKRQINHFLHGVFKNKCIGKVVVRATSTQVNMSRITLCS
jgi:ribonuclease P protein component